MGGDETHVRELAKSMLSFSLALPLFGAQQMGAALSPSRQDRRRAAGGIDAVTGTAARELDADGWLGRLYQVGNCLQSGIVQMGPTLLTPDLLDPRAWVQVSGEVAQRAAEASRVLAEGHGGLLCRELKDKGEVFCLVLDVASLIDIPPDPPLPLGELLERSYALGPFRALWAVEGLGHDYGDSFLQQGIVPSRILNDEATRGLPAESLLMLHAGIGLSFAKRCLDGTRSGIPEAELRSRVSEILRLCRDNSRPGYLGAAYESLGLVTRTFHPDLVPAVDRVVRDIAPEVLGYYWHGVGRAIYFAALNFLPGSDRFVFEMAQREAPDEAARRSAVAGAAWAYALVAQRDPGILAELVIRPYGEQLARNGAFANGVASSAIMRQVTTPDAQLLIQFYQYQPDPSDVALGRLWEVLVRRPCEEALQRIYPVLERRGRLDEVFRYQDLGALAAQLKAEGPR